MVNERKVILASGSPRRRELLGGLTPNFLVIVSDVDETPELGEAPHTLAARLATLKAMTVAKAHPEAIVIGADTVVTFREGNGYRLLNKPADAAEACAMLASLSDRTHEVVTGVCVCSPIGPETFYESTQVTFRALSEAEIADYVATGEPMDKAGSYAIQGGAAGFVEKVEGSLSNVIGLPMERLRNVLSGHRQVLAGQHKGRTPIRRPAF